MILACDIGGTKVTMASFAVTPGAPVMGAVSRFETADYASEDGFAAMLRQHFAGSIPRLQGIGIGVAGPVIGRRVRLTNVAWDIDADHAAELLQAPVYLFNDLVAHGYAVPHLCPASPTALITLQAGQASTAAAAGPQGSGPAVLIAAGTGLGEGILVWRHGRPLVLPSEGGHATFAPVAARDGALADFLRERYGGHVSWERVVSGLDGFRNLFDFLVAREPGKIPAAVVAQLADRHDIGAEIIGAAATGAPYATDILTWFARLYGAEAGNLALKALATGGVYLCGGIAPRIMPYLNSGAFIQGFTAKGRFGPWLQTVPVRLITEPNVALLGAAHFVAAALDKD